MTIRDATGADAPAITAIWNDAIRTSAATFNTREKTVSEVETAISDSQARNCTFLVVENARRIAGFGTYDQFRGGPGYARTMEHTVHLAKGARRQGAGRQLMAEIEKHARDGGAHSMIAAVSGENIDGIAFHKAVGFVETARIPQVGWKFSRWMDLVLLQKFL